MRLINYNATLVYNHSVVYIHSHWFTTTQWYIYTHIGLQPLSGIYTLTLVYNHSVVYIHHSYSFNPVIRLLLHSAEISFRLRNQAGRNKYPYKPKLVGSTGIEPVNSGLKSVYQSVNIRKQNQHSLSTKALLSHFSSVWDSNDCEDFQR